MTGHACALRAFDAHGQSALLPAHPADAELARRLLAAPKAESAGVRRLDGENGSLVLYRPLPLGDGESTGWAALLASNQGLSDAPLELDRLAEAFDEVICAAAREIRSEYELDRMAEELAECYEELHLVYAVDAHIRQSTGRDEALLRLLLKSTAEHMGADVAVYVRPADRLCIFATALSKEIRDFDLVLVKVRSDLLRFVQTSKESVVLNDADDARRPYVFNNMPYRILACPVDVERSVGGIVVLLNHMHKPPFSNSDRRLMSVLANQLSGLAKDELLVRRLGNFTEQMAQALVEAVEAKDPYTRGHSERVNFLSMEIGNALGLPADELQDLHWGSLLHDVGKIGIPDALLSKPAGLTKDEHTFVMMHAERSYEILRDVEQMKNALPGLRHHHEMYDGRGYPHGLKGERIPLHARIMAVADTYDSITSSRAYRAGRSHEMALTEIERVSGSQLDPVMVGSFRKICAREPEWLVQFNIRRDKVS